ncbi:beta-phosphoglucomutase family hydrolase [Gemmobacter fulvus]|uniref:HAD family hydrolase n=1 Tax=Gemmobacter fulvus TaxID=2840474 RepID=UPI00279657EB|nr:beta-phosphoglucomutase family hydrolase [Gemmobacter fulvus]MDQ1846867.1 beta-phosphoglucomutase family hydrolase [Gemmobacter fulvus]
MTLLRGVIFDLDGVIADTVPAHFAAWKQMFAEEGYAFDERVYHDRVDGRRRFDGAQAVMVDASPDRVSAAASRKDAYFLKQIEQGQFEVFADTLNFLRACRAEGLVLATASSSRNARLVLEKAGIADKFAAIVGGDDVSNGKPHPDIFLLAAKRLGLPPEACVVIEDAISGVAAAKAGGFRCIGIDRTGQTERLAGADLIVESLSRLKLCDIEQLMGK